MNENVPANQENTKQPSIFVRNVENLGTFCFSAVNTVFMHFERPFLQRHSISIPFTHTSPHFYAFTHFTSHLFCIYVSSMRNIFLSLMMLLNGESLDFNVIKKKKKRGLRPRK